MKVEITQEAYDKLIDFCQSTQCNWCPFGNECNFLGIQCKIGKPEYWEVLCEVNSND